jgi:hypothetical protein
MLRLSIRVDRAIFAIEVWACQRIRAIALDASAITVAGQIANEVSLPTDGSGYVADSRYTTWRRRPRPSAVDEH